MAREITISYDKGGSETKHFILKEVVLSTMKDMKYCTKKDFMESNTLECDPNQGWTNDYYIEQVVRKLNDHFRYPGCGRLTEDNMIYDKWRNWKTFKSQLHADFSYWAQKEDYLFWRTFKHHIFGKMKIRLHPDKTPPEVYTELDLQSTEKELERMRMKEKRLRTYQQIGGQRSRFLKNDQKWIGETEHKMGGGK